MDADTSIKLLSTAEDVSVSIATTMSATYTFNSALGTLPPEMFTASKNQSPAAARKLRQRMAAKNQSHSTPLHSLFFKPEDRQKLPKTNEAFMRRGADNDTRQKESEISFPDTLSEQSGTDFWVGRDGAGFTDMRGSEYQVENMTGTDGDGPSVRKRTRREAKVGDIPNFIEPKYCLIIVSK